MAFRVELTPRAQLDFAAIASRAIGEAPLRGALWLERFEQSILALSTLPERCPAEPVLSSTRRVVRKLLFGAKRYRYRVYYTISGDSVHVLHIRHGARRRPQRI